MQRKVFSAEFKAKVALEALAGRQTFNEIAGAHEVHPHQVATWNREANPLDAITSQFGQSRFPPSPPHANSIEPRRTSTIQPAHQRTRRGFPSGYPGCLLDAPPSRAERFTPSCCS